MPVQNNLKLKQKLKELKLRSGHEKYTHVSINERGKRSREDFLSKLDQRIVCGYLVVWGHKNMHDEKCIKGSCAKSIRTRGPGSEAKYQITFLWQHRQDDPLAVFAVLEEDDYGLYFETKPLDDVPSADRALKQIRSGTLNQFSMGFDYVWDKIEYDEVDDSLVLLEIELFEGSVVTIGSDNETFACRNVEQINNLYDETEDFILLLPKKDRATARQLFTRHKALIDTAPFEQSNTTGEDENKPPSGLNIDWLIKNL